MTEFLTSPESRAVMLFAAIAAMVVIGAYVASKWRGTTDEDNVGTSELLTNFREMHSKGELTDEEFRTIKAKLSIKLKEELRDSDDTS